MVKILNSFADSIRHAMVNPFGLEFEVHNNKIYVPFGSIINCIGYNDCIERMVGATRGAFACMALISSNDKKERLIACGHICRGVLEMCGHHELYLLVLDVAFTIYNIGYSILNNPKKSKLALALEG